MIKVTLMIMVMTIKIMAIMMMIVHEVTHRHQPGDSAKPGMLQLRPFCANQHCGVDSFYDKLLL